MLFSALTLAGVIIGAHGATRVPDDLFLDDTDVSTPAVAARFGSFTSSCVQEAQHTARTAAQAGMGCLRAGMLLKWQEGMLSN